MSASEVVLIDVPVIVQVSLDCRIGFDYSMATLSKGVEVIKRHKVIS